MADTREHANKAFDLFLATYQDKYPKAAQCLRKDRESLLAFYDFPAQHLTSALFIKDELARSMFLGVGLI